MVTTTMTAKTEIISVVSGKGGTGKTIILASLGYALQTSGHRVLYIDTDTATDGLSLFLLGPLGWEAISDLTKHNTFSDYLREYQEFRRDDDWVVPFKVNRGRQEDHGQIYDVVLSGRGLYGDIKDELNHVPLPDLPRGVFREAIRRLFDNIRRANQWDYVLLDTRGGFGSNTTDACALSDSFFLVTEPHFTSFYQDKNLMFRISAAAAEMNLKPTLRGIIVNKATEFSPTDDGLLQGVHNLSLDKIEASFRNVLVDEFSIRYSDTHPVPLDLEVVQAYKSQKMPYVTCPSSVFSYATLVAFSHLMKTVTVRWPDEATSRWNALVDRISDAIKSENERKIKEVNQQKELREAQDKLKSQNELLLSQVEELKETHERAEKRDAEINQRQDRQDKIRIMSAAAVIGSLFMVILFGYWAYKDSQAASFAQQLKLQELVVSRPSVEQARERWNYSGLIGDWTGRDAEPCTRGAEPDPDRCGSQVPGKVAVCWDNIQFKNRVYPAGALGDTCRNQDQWCTYKDVAKVQVTTLRDGPTPGRVFSCSK